MMLLVITIGALLAAVGAAPQGAPRALVQSSAGAPKEVVIISAENKMEADGSYTWSYEADNGISVSEQGQVRDAGLETERLVVTGTIQYTAPDGTPIKLTYTADENGFQPVGDHLPTPPPTPEAILRALEFNAANPEPEEGAAQIGGGGGRATASVRPSTGPVSTGGPGRGGILGGGNRGIFGRK